MSITIGLISDTHLPDRCRALPPAVFEALDGVDLILHAGDVGAVSVLDELSALAPVVAVHGNDEMAGAPDVLPSQQVIMLAGQRLLLYHGHHPDRAEEMASRAVDAWPPKLARWAGMARRVGASILVYGHTHIPWTVQFDGVWLINPGAIAAGAHTMRQRVQTVARLTLNAAGAPHITYLDLSDLSQPYHPAVDVYAGFTAAINQELIATPDFEAHRRWFFEEIYPIAPEPLLDALRRVMYRCLDGDVPLMTIPLVVTEILADPAIPADAKTQVIARLGDGPRA